MANAQLLNSYMIQSGKKKMALAEKLNISRPRLARILKEPESATYSQAVALTRELEIAKSDMGSIFMT